MLKALFVLDLTRIAGKRLVRKVNLKIYDVINWETNNYNTHIAQYLKK